MVLEFWSEVSGMTLGTHTQGLPSVLQALAAVYGDSLSLPPLLKLFSLIGFEHFHL